MDAITSVAAQHQQDFGVPLQLQLLYASSKTFANDKKVEIAILLEM